MSTLQKKIEKFLKARLWHKDHPYDVLLNTHEEVDEIWNIIKHLPDERAIRKIIRKYREELDDGIGDLLFLVLKLAVMFEIDAEKAVKNTLREFSKRFPAKKLRGHHGNLRMGGIDYKYQKGVKR